MSKEHDIWKALVDLQTAIVINTGVDDPITVLVHKQVMNKLAELIPYRYEPFEYVSPKKVIEFHGQYSKIIVKEV